MLVEVLKVMGNSVAQFHIHRYPVSPDINLNLNMLNNFFWEKYQEIRTSERQHIKIVKYQNTRIFEYRDIMKTKISEHPLLSYQLKFKPGI